MNEPVSNDIDIAISWMYVAADTLGKREDLYELLCAAKRIASDMHGLPPEEDFTADQEPTIDILTRCVEYWDELDRHATDDEWEEATRTPIEAAIVATGRKGKDGSMLWWIRATGDQAERLSGINARGGEVSIQLEVGTQKYNGRFRYTESNQYAQINPFVTYHDVEHSISRILTEAGIMADKPISLVRVRNTIRVRQGK